MILAIALTLCYKTPVFKIFDVLYMLDMVATSTEYHGLFSIKSRGDTVDVGGNTMSYFTLYLLYMTMYKKRYNDNSVM